MPNSDASAEPDCEEMHTVSLWKKFFGSSEGDAADNVEARQAQPAPAEPAIPEQDAPPQPDATPQQDAPPRPVAQGEDYHEDLVQEGLAHLARFGFEPNWEVDATDIRRLMADGEADLERRPLTTLLLLTSESGVPLFDRHFVDDGPYNRTTAEDLVEFLEESAAAAGTEVTGIRTMLDYGSSTSGSLRFTHGLDVFDVSFDLDQDFGDEMAEDDILLAVTPEGYESICLVAGEGMNQVTVWAPAQGEEGTAEELFDLLEIENRQPISG